MNHRSEEQEVTLRSVSSLVLAQIPQVSNHIRKQSRFPPLQFPEAFARDAARVPVRTEIRPVYDRQQQLDQHILRLSLDDDVFRCADENRGGGDHELVLEGGSRGVDGRMDDGFKRVDETVEVVVGGEEGEGEFVEEDEELELEGEREVLPVQRGEKGIEERIQRAPFAVHAVLEAFD